MNSHDYPGTELELFEKATVWKSYLARQIRPFLGSRVLEIGAGIGGTTRRLVTPTCEEWCCLEPDPRLAEQIEDAIASHELPGCCCVSRGLLEDIPPDRLYDSLLYIDVLEHIEDDRRELKVAAQRMSPGGFLVVLSPAHQWLFTAFDAGIGHYRRYSKKSLTAVAPAGIKLVRLVYLDSVGMLASMANRLLLRSSMPTARQIAFWDRVLVRCSRVVDRVTFHTLGRCVLAVWQKPAGAE